MKRYCLLLDLKDNQELIQEYIEYHQAVWPEILSSIELSGITSMEIFHISTRLFMIIEAEDQFSFEKKAEIDKNNPKVEEWERLMDTYQQRLPFAKPDQKWVLMERIFNWKA